MSQPSPQLPAFALWVLCFFGGLYSRYSIAPGFTTRPTRLLLGLSLVALLFLWRWWRQQPGTLLLCLGLAFGLGWLWLPSPHAADRETQRFLAQELGGRHWFQGQLTKAWRFGAQSASSTALLYRWAHQPKGPWHSLRLPIKLVVRGRPQLTPGHHFRTRLRLRYPRMYQNPGLRSPSALLRYQGIQFQASARLATLTPLGTPPRSHIQKTIAQTRATLQQWLAQHVEAQESRAVLQALLLGNKSTLSSQRKEAFARTGTSHLLAISGLHLAIVCSLLFLLLRWSLAWSSWLATRLDTTRLAAALTLPGALAYTLLSGASIATQRAFVMATLYFGSLILFRRVHIHNTLALAALLLTLYEATAPLTLSFQLSFVAVLALVLGNQRRHDHYQTPGTLNVSKHWQHKLWMLAWTSVIATLGTLPISLSFSPHLPWLAPLANLLALPLGGYGVVGLGLLALFLSTIAPSLAQLPLQGSVWCAKLLLGWIDVCAKLPGHDLSWWPLRPAEIVLYYCGLLGGWGCYHKQRKLLRLSVLVGGIALCGLCWPSLRSTWQQPRLRIDFLDVGQGDAMLIHFPHGKKMLVDGGGEPFVHFDVGARVLRPSLRWKRIQKLDYVVLSHPHPDHFGGFPSLLPHLKVGEFWTNDQTGHHPHFRRLQQVLRDRKIKKRRFLRPTCLWIDGVKVEILHPFPGPYEGKSYYWGLHANDNSLVLRLSYGKHRFLLAGDIEERAEEIIRKRWEDLRADVLKVPHHGSRTSSTAAFLDRVKPTHALFGVGRLNIFGFPHPSVIRRYKKRQIKVWRTDLHGQITIESDGTQLNFRSQLHPAPAALYKAGRRFRKH